MKQHGWKRRKKEEHGDNQQTRNSTVGKKKSKLKTKKTKIKTKKMQK
jgi:hypothetical protein